MKLMHWLLFCFSINDINSFNLERIITVKGSIENMSKAEAMISAKLRQSYENDLQAMAVSFFTENNFLIFRKNKKADSFGCRLMSILCLLLVYFLICSLSYKGPV